MACYDDTEDIYGEELKGMDTMLTVSIGGVVSTNTTNEGAFCLNLIQEGVNGLQRIGDFIKLKSLLIKLTGICRYSPAGDGGGMVANLLRAIVVWDKDPNGTTVLPDFNDIIGTAQGTGSLFAPLTGEVNYQFVNRFEILADTTMLSTPKVYYPAGDLSRASETIHQWEQEIDLNGLTTTFKSSSTPMTVGNIYSGALYLYVRGLVNTSGLSQWYLPNTSWCRLRYTNV